MELSRLVVPAIAALMLAGLPGCSKGEELVDPSVPLVVAGVKLASTTPLKLFVELEGAPRAVMSGSVLVKVSMTGKVVAEDELPLAGNVTLTRGKETLPMAEAVTAFTQAYEERLPVRCALPGEDDWICTGKGVLDVSVEVTAVDGKVRTPLAGPARFDVEVK